MSEQAQLNLRTATQLVCPAVTFRIATHATLRYTICVSSHYIYVFTFSHAVCSRACSRLGVGNVLALENIQSGTRVCGIAGPDAVDVLAVRWHGRDALAVTYEMSNGALGEQLVYRFSQHLLQLAPEKPVPQFQEDAGAFRIASEAYRIHLAHVFDPYLAMHTSAIDPLPHQITAVYEEMLPRLPLRFVLADDPGAGKTVTTGLFIKELVIRSGIVRCLITTPAPLTQQWRDEMQGKFGLRFRILTGKSFNNPSTAGNPFEDNTLCVMSIDTIARNPVVQAKLREIRWDLVVCDEAHRLSATVSAGKVKHTKRSLAAHLLSSVANHYLLLTATPHNGKEKDFRLFMSLVDPDRFVASAHSTYSVAPDDVADVMRRMVKEDLVRADGTPLFPERRAYTLTYSLSQDEATLYEAVTQYVLAEFNRSERLDSGRRNVIGFALTVLQRRLASSPEAIYQSLRRRREKLEERRLASGRAEVDLDDVDSHPIDPEDEENVAVYRATAARTVAELDAEIRAVARLEEMAARVRSTGLDRKWQELATLLEHNKSMFRPDGSREKLIVFSEHRDTLSYLDRKIGPLLHNGEKIVMIHGGMAIEARHRAESQFWNDPGACILLATDAAGEGVNLHCAHLMVNYDLPWNPNRLEQRFGRIHRIGQTQVCHLWNLVSSETREGMVYQRLLQKLETESRALNGKVFNVLGKLTFGRRTLSDLLTEAIRYNDRADVRKRLFAAIDKSLDHKAVVRLLNEQALACEVLGAEQVMTMREDLERAIACGLQPYAVESFFLAAFRGLGGRIRPQGGGRYQVTHVPMEVRQKGVTCAAGFPVKAAYERICFDKSLRAVEGEPPAELIAPGHPLLDTTIQLVLEGAGNVLKDGAVLVDEGDRGMQPRLLFGVRDAVQDGVVLADGKRREVSTSLHFVELRQDGSPHDAGCAPYLDYRPPDAEEEAILTQHVARQGWLRGPHEMDAIDYAISHIVPQHVAEVRARTTRQMDKTALAVRERLGAEIGVWRERATELRAEGSASGRMQAIAAERQAKELERRLQSRMELVDREKMILAAPPSVVSRSVVVPRGLLDWLMGRAPQPGGHAAAWQRNERIAVEVVLGIERSYGYEPVDARTMRRGYAVESRIPEALRKPGESALRFLAIKPYVSGTTRVFVARSEILTALNAPGQFVLALVEMREGAARALYLTRPFSKMPSFDAAGAHCGIAQLVRGADLVMDVTSRQDGAPRSVL